MSAELLDEWRPALVRHAYRMLGSVSDAEDTVQDAYVRWFAGSRGDVRDPRAYLRATVTHLCLDRLTSAKARHECYIGPWLPEPLVEDETALPTHAAQLSEDVSFAFMLALERLSPLERAAFLLHDVLDTPFSEIAEMLDRGEAAVRQLASRGREHVRDAHRTRAVHRGESERARSEFMRAIRADDVAALTQLFTQDAVLRSDGGGKAIAATNPIVGPGRIARFVAGVVRKYRDALHSRAVTVNGEPGFIISIRGVLVQALALEIDAGHISAVYVMRNPDKLHAIAERYGLITEDQVG